MRSFHLLHSATPSLGDESCVLLFKFHKGTVDSGKEGTRDLLLSEKEGKEGRNFPGRSVVWVLSFRGSLFCRPQTPRRMIHKNAIFWRVRLSSAIPLLARVSPSDSPEEQIDLVDRRMSFSDLVNNARTATVSRRIVGGHRRGGKVPGDKGKGDAGQMKNS
ncbi:hypothetical protein ACS0PU_005215 [Formica fusca]